MKKALRTAAPGNVPRPVPRGNEDGLEVGDGEVVVVLRDEALRDSLADLRWRLDGLLETGPATLAIDMSEVTRLSSAATAVLLLAKRRCLARGVRVVVRHPSRSSVALLERAGLWAALEADSTATARRSAAHRGVGGRTASR